MKIQTHWLKPLMLAFACVFLVSCSPVYKVAYDFQPPKSQQGLSCLKGCESQQKQCDLNCNRQYSQCAKNAQSEAKKLLPSLLAAYPEKLEIWLLARDAYERDLDYYEFQRDLYESRRYRYLDRCEKSGKKRKHCIKTYRPSLFYPERPVFSLPRPIKPTLQSVTQNLIRNNCQTSCGCDARYRTCYSSCGGVVKSKRICIKNCQ